MPGLKFGGTATPIDEAEPYEPDGVYPDGVYLVGKDIPEGEYKVHIAENGIGFAYIQVSKDAKGTLDSIISNENFEHDIYQSVKDGQYLKLSGAYIEADE